MSPVETQVREILSTVVGGEVAAGVGSEDRIFERGVVDSLHLVELVDAIESRFGVAVDGDDLQPANFESIAAMAAYVQRKGGR